MKKDSCDRSELEMLITAAKLSTNNLNDLRFVLILNVFQLQSVNNFQFVESGIGSKRRLKKSKKPIQIQIRVAV